MNKNNKALKSQLGGGAKDNLTSKKVFKPFIASSLALALGVSVAVADPSITYGTTPNAGAEGATQSVSLNNLSWFNNGGLLTPSSNGVTIENLRFEFDGRYGTDSNPSGILNGKQYTITMGSTVSSERQPYLLVKSTSGIKVKTLSFYLTEGKGSSTQTPRTMELDLSGVENGYALDGNLDILVSETWSRNSVSKFVGSFGGRGISGNVALKKENPPTTTDTEASVLTSSFTFLGDAGISGDLSVNLTSGNQTFVFDQGTIGGKILIGGAAPSQTGITYDWKQVYSYASTSILFGNGKNLYFNANKIKLTSGSLTYGYTDDATGDKIITLTQNNSYLGGNLTLKGMKQVVLTKDLILTPQTRYTDGGGTRTDSMSTSFIFNESDIIANKNQSSNPIISGGNISNTGGTLSFTIANATSGINPFTNSSQTNNSLGTYYIDGNITIQNGGLSAFWDDEFGFTSKLGFTSGHTLSITGDLVGRNNVWFSAGSLAANGGTATIGAIKFANAGASHLVFEDAIIISGGISGRDMGGAVTSQILFQKDATIEKVADSDYAIQIKDGGASPTLELTMNGNVNTLNGGIYADGNAYWGAKTINITFANANSTNSINGNIIATSHGNGAMGRNNIIFKSTSTNTITGDIDSSGRTNIISSGALSVIGSIIATTGASDTKDNVVIETAGFSVSGDVKTQGGYGTGLKITSSGKNDTIGGQLLAGGSNSINSNEIILTAQNANLTINNGISFDGSGRGEGNKNIITFQNGGILTVNGNGITANQSSAKNIITFEGNNDAKITANIYTHNYNGRNIINFEGENNTIEGLLNTRSGGKIIITSAGMLNITGGILAETGGNETKDDVMIETAGFNITGDVKTDGGWGAGIKITSNGENNTITGKLLAGGVNSINSNEIILAAENANLTITEGIVYNNYGRGEGNQNIITFQNGGTLKSNIVTNQGSVKSIITFNETQNASSIIGDISTGAGSARTNIVFNGSGNNSITGNITTNNGPTNITFANGINTITGNIKAYSGSNNIAFGDGINTISGDIFIQSGAKTNIASEGFLTISGSITAATGGNDTKDDIVIETAGFNITGDVKTQGGYGTGIKITSNGIDNTIGGMLSAYGSNSINSNEIILTAENANLTVTGGISFDNGAWGRSGYNNQNTITFQKGGTLQANINTIDNLRLKNTIIFNGSETINTIQGNITNSGRGKTSITSEGMLNIIGNITANTAGNDTKEDLVIETAGFNITGNVKTNGGYGTGIKITSSGMNNTIGGMLSAYGTNSINSTEIILTAENANLTVAGGISFDNGAWGRDGYNNQNIITFQNGGTLQANISTIDNWRLQNIITFGGDGLITGNITKTGGNATSQNNLIISADNSTLTLQGGTNQITNFTAYAPSAGTSGVSTLLIDGTLNSNATTIDTLANGENLIVKFNGQGSSNTASLTLKKTDNANDVEAKKLTLKGISVESNSTGNTLYLNNSPTHATITDRVTIADDQDLTIAINQMQELSFSGGFETTGTGYSEIKANGGNSGVTLSGGDISISKLKLHNTSGTSTTFKSANTSIGIFATPSSANSITLSDTASKVTLKNVENTANNQSQNPVTFSAVTFQGTDQTLEFGGGKSIITTVTTNTNSTLELSSGSTPETANNTEVTLKNTTGTNNLNIKFSGGTDDQIHHSTLSISGASNQLASVTSEAKNAIIKLDGSNGASAVTIANAINITDGNSLIFSLTSGTGGSNTATATATGGITVQSGGTFGVAIGAGSDAKTIDVGSTNGGAVDFQAGSTLRVDFLSGASGTVTLGNSSQNGQPSQITIESGRKSIINFWGNNGNATVNGGITINGGDNTVNFLGNATLSGITLTSGTNTINVRDVGNGTTGVTGTIVLNGSGGGSGSSTTYPSLGNMTNTINLENNATLIVNNNTSSGADAGDGVFTSSANDKPSTLNFIGDNATFKGGFKADGQGVAIINVGYAQDAIDKPQGVTIAEEVSGTITGEITNADLKFNAGKSQLTLKGQTNTFKTLTSNATDGILYLDASGTVDVNATITQAINVGAGTSLTFALNSTNTDNKSATVTASGGITVESGGTLGIAIGGNSTSGTRSVTIGSNGTKPTLKAGSTLRVDFLENSAGTATLGSNSGFTIENGSKSEINFYKNSTARLDGGITLKDGGTNTANFYGSATLEGITLSGGTNIINIKGADNDANKITATVGVSSVGSVTNIVNLENYAVLNLTDGSNGDGSGTLTNATVNVGGTSTKIQGKITNATLSFTESISDLTLQGEGNTISSLKGYTPSLRAANTTTISNTLILDGSKASSASIARMDANTSVGLKFGSGTEAKTFTFSEGGNTISEVQFDNGGSTNNTLEFAQGLSTITNLTIASGSDLTLKLGNTADLTLTNGYTKGSGNSANLKVAGNAYTRGETIDADSLVFESPSSSLSISNPTATFASVDVETNSGSIIANNSNTTITALKGDNLTVGFEGLDSSLITISDNNDSTHTITLAGITLSANSLNNTLDLTSLTKATIASTFNAASGLNIKLKETELALADGVNSNSLETLSIGAKTTNGSTLSGGDITIANLNFSTNSSALTLKNANTTLSTISTTGTNALNLDGTDKDVTASIESNTVARNLDITLDGSTNSAVLILNGGVFKSLSLGNTATNAASNILALQSGKTSFIGGSGVSVANGKGLSLYVNNEATLANTISNEGTAIINLEGSAKIQGNVSATGTSAATTFNVNEGANAWVIGSVGAEGSELGINLGFGSTLTLSSLSSSATTSNIVFKKALTSSIADEEGAEVITSTLASAINTTAGTTKISVEEGVNANVAKLATIAGDGLQVEIASGSSLTLPSLSTSATTSSITFKSASAPSSRANTQSVLNGTLKVKSGAMTLGVESGVDAVVANTITTNAPASTAISLSSATLTLSQGGNTLTSLSAAGRNNTLNLSNGNTALSGDITTANTSDSLAINLAENTALSFASLQNSGSTTFNLEASSQATAQSSITNSKTTNINFNGENSILNGSMSNSGVANINFNASSSTLNGGITTTDSGETNIKLASQNATLTGALSTSDNATTEITINDGIDGVISGGITTTGANAHSNIIFKGTSTLALQGDNNTISNIDANNTSATLYIDGVNNNSSVNVGAIKGDSLIAYFKGDNSNTKTLSIQGGTLKGVEIEGENNILDLTAATKTTITNKVSTSQGLTIKLAEGELENKNGLDIQGSSSIEVGNKTSKGAILSGGDISIANLKFTATADSEAQLTFDNQISNISTLSNVNNADITLLLGGAQEVNIANTDASFAANFTASRGVSQTLRINGGTNTISNLTLGDNGSYLLSVGGGKTTLENITTNVSGKVLALQISTSSDPKSLNSSEVVLSKTLTSGNIAATFEGGSSDQRYRSTLTLIGDGKTLNSVTSNAKNALVNFQGEGNATIRDIEITQGNSLLLGFEGNGDATISLNSAKDIVIGEGQTLGISIGGVGSRNIGITTIGGGNLRFETGSTLLVDFQATAAGDNIVATLGDAQGFEIEKGSKSIINLRGGSGKSSLKGGVTLKGGENTINFLGDTALSNIALESGDNTINVYEGITGEMSVENVGKVTNTINLNTNSTLVLSENGSLISDARGNTLNFIGNNATLQGGFGAKEGASQKATINIGNTEASNVVGVVTGDVSNAQLIFAGSDATLVLQGENNTITSLQGFSDGVSYVSNTLSLDSTNNAVNAVISTAVVGDAVGLEFGAGSEDKVFTFSESGNIISGGVNINNSAGNNTLAFIKGNSSLGAISTQKGEILNISLGDSNTNSSSSNAISLNFTDTLASEGGETNIHIKGSDNAYALLSGSDIEVNEMVFGAQQSATLHLQNSITKINALSATAQTNTLSIGAKDNNVTALFTQSINADNLTLNFNAQDYSAAVILGGESNTLNAITLGENSSETSSNLLSLSTGNTTVNKAVSIGANQALSVALGNDVSLELKEGANNFGDLEFSFQGANANLIGDINSSANTTFNLGNGGSEANVEITGVITNSQQATQTFNINASAVNLTNNGSALKFNAGRNIINFIKSDATLSLQNSNLKTTGGESIVNLSSGNATFTKDIQTTGGSTTLNLSNNTLSLANTISAMTAEGETLPQTTIHTLSTSSNAQSIINAKSGASLIANVITDGGETTFNIDANTLARSTSANFTLGNESTVLEAKSGGINTFNLNANANTLTIASLKADGEGSVNNININSSGSTELIFNEMIENANGLNSINLNADGINLAFDTEGKKIATTLSVRANDILLPTLSANSADINLTLSFDKANSTLSLSNGVRVENGGVLSVVFNTNSTLELPTQVAQFTSITSRSEGALIDLANGGRTISAEEIDFRLLSIGDATQKGDDGLSGKVNTMLYVNKETTLPPTQSRTEENSDTSIKGVTLGGESANSASDIYGYAHSDRVLIKDATNPSSLVLNVIPNLDQLLELSYQGGGTEKQGNVALATVKNGLGVDVSTQKVTIGFETVEAQLQSASTSESGIYDANGEYTTYFLGGAKSTGATLEVQEVVSAALSVNYDLYLANFNSLNKRMGELRENPYNQGVWARVFGGAMSNDFGAGSNTQYVTAQMGYDYSLEIGSDARNYMGIALSYGTSTTKSNTLTQSGVVIGSSSIGLNDVTSNMVEVGVYNSYVSDSGWYNDTIFKFDYIMSDFTMSNDPDQTSSTNNFALVLSDEFGYRYQFGGDKSYFVDPQVELGLGWFNQSDFNRSIQSQLTGTSILNAAQDSILTLRTRVGASVGKKFNTNKGFASLYVGAFYEYDYIEGGSAEVSVGSGVSNGLQSLQSNGRAIVNLGSNIELDDGARIYIDVEKSFGDMHRTHLQFNVGARYSFGEKSQRVINNKGATPLKISAPLSSEETQEESNTQQESAEQSNSSQKSE